jgi:hypothetical protein
MAEGLGSLRLPLPRLLRDTAPPLRRLAMRQVGVVRIEHVTVDGAVGTVESVSGKTGADEPLAVEVASPVEAAGNRQPAGGAEGDQPAPGTPGGQADSITDSSDASMKAKHIGYHADGVWRPWCEVYDLAPDEQLKPPSELVCAQCFTIAVLEVIEELDHER